jgi:hypothetical protein
LTSAGLFTVSGGAAVHLVGGACTLLAGHLAQGDGFFGVTDGPAVVLQGDVVGKLDWTGGGLAGQWTIATNGVFTLSGEASKHLLGSVSNFGTVYWSGGAVTAYNLGVPGVAQAFWNMPEGIINLTDDLHFVNAGGMADFEFHNTGVLRKLGGVGAARFDNILFFNDGSLEVWSGILSLGYWNGCQWFNSGSVTLGVAGPNNCSRIQAFGAADLSGHLEVALLNGYIPVGGESFELFDYSSANVAFTSITTLPALPGGLYLAPRVGSEQLMLEVHQDPAGNPDAFTLNEDTPTDLDVLANDKNLYGGEVLSYTPPSHGTLSLNGNNTLHYIPAMDYFGADSFTYQARNADNRIISAGVTLQVLPVNDVPVLAPIADQTIDELTLLTFKALATDVEGDQLTFTLGGAPSGAAIDSLSGVFAWTPSEAQGPGVYPITVTVTDNGTPNQSTSQTFTVTVREVNSAPVLSTVANQTVPELQPFSLQLSAIDPDLPANALTFMLVSGPAGLAVSPGGLLTWTPAEAQGPSTNHVTVAAKDDGQPSLSTTQSFQVVVTEVNTAPVLPCQTNLVMDELALLVVTNTATDSDVPINLLTYTLLNAPQGAAIDTNGIITWTPTEAQGPSSNLFVTVVTDNGQPPLSATNSFVVLVNEVNSAPVLSAIANQTVPELQALGLQLSAADSDLPANTLTYFLVSGPAGLTVSPAGLLTWTPSEAQGPSTNQVTVAVKDDGQPSLSATQSFQVVVAEVNTVPVLAAISNQTGPPAQTFSLTLSATDADLPANTLTFTLDAAPAGAAVTPGGLFTWTPTFAQAGTTNAIVVRVTDNGTPPMSCTQPFSMTVLNTGLKADYFAGTNFDTLALTRDDAQVDFNWSTGSPGPGVPTNRFSTRWTGQLIPRYSQTYTFYTISDDGVRLWVDGQPIINNWTAHLATTNTGTIALTAGQPYVLRLEYFSASTGAVCRLMWSSSSQAKEIVPNSRLLCTGYSDPIPNAIYRLTPKLATGRSMEVPNGGTADGTQVDIKDWKAATYQKWQAIPVGSNYFKLVPQHATSKVLEVNGGYTTNGTKIQIATDNGASRQRFTFANQGQGWFEIQPLSAPASVLQLKGGASGNGTAVQLNQDTGTDGQRWRLDRQ